ncbi:MAG: STT3 domain-containing protein, partial [Candidatus Hydrothermarchaeales archaeon]
MKRKELSVLAGILLVAFAIRLIFYRHGYLYGVDPYYHYDNSRALLEQGTILFTFGLYTPNLVLYQFLKYFNVSFYDNFRLTTPVFGVLTIIPVYYLVKEFFDRRVAQFSGLILAFLPAFIGRTLSGNYRGDPYSLFFTCLGFYLFIVSIRGFSKRSFVYALLAGVCFAFVGMVWSV